MENQAAEARLDVARRTPEPIVKIEMAKGRLDIVAPEQAYDPAAEPDALGIAGRTGDHALGFGIFVDLVELVLAGRAGFIGRFRIGTLGKGRESQRDLGCGK